MKDISLHILDIVQNSITAGASLITCEITESKKQNIYQVSITDNGKGMDSEVLQKVTNPFYTSRTTRKVGLGIPLLKHNAELTGGSFQLESEPGKGTRLTATFVYNHIDRLPAGDLAGTFVLLTAANPLLDFVYNHVTDIGQYVFDTREVKAVLEELSISDPALRSSLIEMIHENLNEIGAKK